VVIALYAAEGRGGKKEDIAKATVQLTNRLGGEEEEK